MLQTLQHEMQPYPVTKQLGAVQTAVWLCVWVGISRKNKLLH